ncbi:MAG: NAD-glutamate dehydrogenase [Burkholderiaceae bacterium]
MDTAAQAHKAERIEAIIDLARSRLSVAKPPWAELFVRELFRRVEPEDLAARSVVDLCGAALSALEWTCQRLAGQARLRVFNPGIDQGWNSRHTVIEIVNDDMPFLVDSVIMEINRQGLALHGIWHPLFDVERNRSGQLTALSQHGQAERRRESVMVIEVDRISDPEARERLLAGLTRVLADVRAVVEDWPAMRSQLAAAIDELAASPSRLPPDQLDEYRAFLDWLADNHLVLLGYRRHDLIEVGTELRLRRVAGSGLGTLRETAATLSVTNLPPQAHVTARSPEPVIVTKANSRATVHRPGYVDYIGIKRFDAQGVVIGEHRFLGLLTSSAYAARVAEIPLVRGQVERVLRRMGLVPGSHLAKAAAHILETYPRDELFQIRADELFEILGGILALGERQRLRLFVRRDPYERFVSCLIFVPRDAYSTELRMKFQSLLSAAFEAGASEFDVRLTEEALARIHITVRTTPGRLPAVDVGELESRLAQAARRWNERLREALVNAEGEALAVPWLRRWANGFPAAYREQEPVSVAVADLRKLESLDEGGVGFALYRPLVPTAGRIGFKLYHADVPVPLSDSLPMLESMGVRALEEHPYPITEANGAVVWIHDFLLEIAGAETIDVETVAPVFEDVFARVFAGELECDGFNRLVLRAGIDAAGIVVLRAYAKYLKQTRFELSQAFIEATLAAHPRIAHQLVHLFGLRFDPQAADPAAEAAQVRAIEQALDRVANLNQDRALRQLLALIEATLRTNAWRGRHFLSLKFDSSRVPGLPDPRPWVEVFVYSIRFEGIHLRGGKVARGGLRWSDRPEDFRTEVLGLVKAQRVKNTVIVPVGSKGGFVLKKAPPATEREAFLREGVACYQDYLRGLLDITDNWVDGRIVAPERVVRHDDDDPYLVVAADKGTASFSDTANAISAEYGFWLGDAFASGGSAGYDHKAMGITARGAWEAVKRHFRELGRDIQSTPFTVAGIGDMSGDVFGNGMLLSRQTQLVAAFDHRHVFLDPAPDAAASFAERERLFALPRSSWADYDAGRISAGGGVWSRTEKSIPVSPQAAAVLGIEPGRLAPNEVISAVLRAPVDLLYNGGIGTYVKAADETSAEVGDRANDSLRVNGGELRCKVVGEGGNLGFTQRGRIEYALAGGRINTDAIDNSAGVDTSDHEVNIKILLGSAIARGELAWDQRDALLASMSNDVAALVLADNINQTQVLSVGGRVAAKLLDQQARFIRFLERSGKLDRRIEFLPDEDTIADRRARGLGLTSPERAVVLAYSKIWLRGELIASDLPEDAGVARELPAYFPAALREKSAAAMPSHLLRREIVVTAILNSMINRVGPTFVHRLVESTGASAAQVVRAYLIVREVFGLPDAWRAIEALDNQVDDAVQAALLIELGRLTVRATAWFLRRPRLAAPLAETLVAFTPVAAADTARRIQRGQGADMAERWIAQGVPAALAQRVAVAEASFAALDIAEISAQTARSVDEVAAIYAAVGERLGLVRLAGQIAALPAEGHWPALARVAAADELAAVARGVTIRVLSLGATPAAALERWQQTAADALERVSRVTDELAEARGADLAMISVALRELRALG